MPTGLEIALAGVLVLFLAVGLVGLLRPGLGPAPFWIGGWMAAGVSGVLLLLAQHFPGLQLASYPLGTLFPFLLLAGALELADRPVPRWLLPGALVLGLARAALAAAGAVPAAYGLAVALEPAVVLVAAWVLHQSTSRAAGLAQRLLAPSFVLLAMGGGLHLLWLMLDFDPQPVLTVTWMVLAPPTLGLQIYVVADRNRRELRRAHENLEQRVRVRTRELDEANRALRASEARYRTVSELSSDFSFACRLGLDLQLSVEWVTEAFQRIVGIDLARISGRGWLDLLPSETRAQIVDLLREARAGEHVVRDVPLYTAQRGERCLEVRLHTFATAVPGELRVVGAASDVTDARRADAERRELERRMHESARLESLGRLSGGIAHDFNNLLSVVLGNARLAEADLPDVEKVRNRVKRIRAAGEHAARLTEQMLTYAGKAPTDRRVIDVSRSVEEMTELVRAALPEGCLLEVDLEPGLRVEADETQIRQVVLNLVTNAGEALEQGGGRVALRTSHVRAGAADLVAGQGAADPPPGDYVVLEVRDSGCGMDPETRERIFDPFFSTKFTGRGMGLASVLGIVRAHGGVVSLESAAGRGTAARVLLPRVREAPSPSVASPRPQPVQPRTGRVLVVDDDPGVLEIAAEFLRREGFEVTAELSGREGIETLRAEGARIDVVLLDLSMPEMAGEEVFLKMRAIRPGLPVILASGFSEEFASERFKAPGVVGFLRKPYGPDELVACVRAALSPLADD